jgi:tetratricopeptide (TPR) repeat protein
MAWTLKMKKQYEESRRLFETLAGGGAKSDLSIQSDIMIALIARAQGNFQEAAERLEAIASKVNEGEKSLGVLLEIQAAYVYFYDLNDVTRARQALERAKKYAPKQSLAAGFLDRELEPFFDRNLRDAAFEQMRLGNYQEARKLFKDALEIDPKDAWVYSGLGLTQKLLGENLLEAIEVTQKGHELKADEYTAAAIGYLFELKNEKDVAVNFYKKAIQINPDYLVAVYNLGRLYLMMGQYENASSRFLWIKEKGKKLPEVYSRAMNNLGCCWWQMGLKGQAAGALQEAVRADPKIAEAHYNLSIYYELSGETKLALEEKDKSIELEPKLATLGAASGLVSV